MSARGCTVCGLPLSVVARFCPRCGAESEPPAAALGPSVPSLAAAWPMAAPKTVGSATAALVLGILTWWLPFVAVGLVTWVATAPLSVVLGAAARARIDDDPASRAGRGLATAGLTLGLVWLIGVTVVVSALVAVRLF